MSIDPRALRILRATMERYQGCRSYRDCGRIRFRSGRGGAEDHEVFFTTDFVRPDLLRFDSGSLAGTGSALQRLAVSTVLWSGEGVRAIRGHFAGEADWPSMGASMAWASRLDGAATEYLPHLLLGDRFPHAEEAEARYLGETNLEGTRCHRLLIPSRGGRASYLLWIETSSLHLRALREQRTRQGRDGVDMFTPSERSERTTIEFNPVLDARVDPVVFEEPRSEHSRLSRYLELS